MPNYKDKFQQGNFYHVYNRAIGNDKLFVKEANFYHFLSLYRKRLSAIVETFAYCLLPNHFHLLIRVMDELTDAEKVVSEAFRRLEISYVQAINIQENRKGSLFMRPVKRVAIEEDSYLTRIIIYIHQNPYRHGLTDEFANYKWSSYPGILSDKPTLLKRQEVLDWFGGEIPFVKAHEKYEEESHFIL